MASHVFLLFFNAILLMVITCGVALYILKKEYAPFLEKGELSVKEGEDKEFRNANFHS